MSNRCDEAKLAVNEAREWPPAVEGEPCEHVLEDDVTWPLRAAKSIPLADVQEWTPKVERQEFPAGVRPPLEPPKVPAPILSGPEGLLAVMREASKPSMCSWVVEQLQRLADEWQAEREDQAAEALTSTCRHDIVSSAVEINYDGYITYTLNGRKVSRREYLEATQ